MPSLLMAERKPARLLLLNSSLALLLLVSTLGILKKDTSLSRPDRLEQPKTTQSTIAVIVNLYTTTRIT